MRFLVFCALLFSILLPVVAQQNSTSPYEITWKKESPYLISGAAMLLTANVLRNKTTNFTLDELSLLNVNDINRFDRKATTYYSEKIDKTSDYFWYGSHALPFLFFTQKELHKDAVVVGSMYSEVLLLNVGATLLSKYTFRRARPFAYNADAPLEERLGNSAKTALVSGHTSMTAANTFFVAQVFSTYYPESKWKPLVWTSAIVLPAVTGYLRVRAGRHFPTDVMAGYALGATIGYFVPKLHEKADLKGRGISLNVGMNSAHIAWRF